MFLAVAFGCKLKRDKRGFGEECVNGEDCTSEMCTSFGNICSKACTYDRDCGKNFVCRSDGSAAGNSCAKPIGAPVNGACRSAEGCASGHCIKFTGKDDQPGLCSRYCQTADDCPAGMKTCDKLSNTGLLKMCLPDEQKPQPTATQAPTQDPPKQQQQQRQQRKKGRKR